MELIGITVAIATLTLTVLGLVVALAVFMTEIRTMVAELVADRPLVRRVPVLEYRIDKLEQNVSRISECGGE